MGILLDSVEHRRSCWREHAGSQSTRMASPVIVRDLTATFRLAFAGLAAQGEVYEPSGLTN